MAQQKATNTFTKGMICDMNDLDVSNDVLINALNATTSTFNGNEGALQNDMGNILIGFTDTLGVQHLAQLPKGYVPVGSVEYGGIIYIASVDANNNCEIGSFPSPLYPIEEGSNYCLDSNFPSFGNLQYVYSPLYVGYSDLDNASIPLNTEYFNFSLEHPVSILAEKAFDGTVNLILNDGINTPKLINTGFHAQAEGTYEIIKRFGKLSNNTNRYRLDKGKTFFDLQTSLYRDNSAISNFTYNGVGLGGLLKVGNYVFYAITCDKDGNESDIIAESGVVSIFKGTDGNPFSVDGGISNETTDKSVSFTVSPIDECYNYIKIYYTRCTSQNNLNAETLAYKINHLYQVYNGVCELKISGYENTTLVSVDDINIQYFNADTAKALELSLNILFLGNIKEKDIDSLEYELLRNLSVLILPKIIKNKDGELDFTFNLNSDYSSETNLNYYNSSYIYNYTGYHSEEFYRFGIIYIRMDNSLTSVFDVLGVDDLGNSANYIDITDVDLSEVESKSYLHFENGVLKCSDTYATYNSKGVSRISSCLENLTDVIGIQFTIPDHVKTKLTENNHYKGYLFVRQKRIPTTLGQGYVTNICEESFLPSINIPTYGADTLTTTEDIVNSDKQGKKLYLYESFISGALKNNLSNLDYNFYPKRTASRPNSSLNLTNNYKSRLFTLSDYTYLYLDKLIGEGPVSAFYLSIGVLDASEFRLLTYQVINYTESNDGKPIEHECAFVYYMTPEKWDDKALSDGSSGRPLLVVTDKANTDVICYIHGFVKLKTPVNINEYKRLIARDINSNTTKEDAQKVSYETYNAVTLSWELAVDSNNNEKTLELLSALCDVSLASSMNGNKKHTVRQSNASVSDLEQNIAASGKLKLAAKTESYDYTEIMAMVNRYNNTQNAGMLLQFYLKDTSGNVDVLLELEGSFYKPYIAMAAHDSHSQITSVDGIISEISSYINKYERLLNPTDSELLQDPTTPTFDGKYSYEDSINEDELRVKLHTMQLGAYGMYFPEYELNLPYYNNLFTGLQFKIKPWTDAKLLTILNDFKDRHYIYDNITVSSDYEITDCKAISVLEDTTLLMIKKFKDTTYKGEDYNLETNLNTLLYYQRSNNYFSSKASAASEIGFKFVGGKSLAHINLFDYSENCAEGKVNNKAPYNIVRGIYGPYIGVTSPENIADKIVTIYIPGYDLDNGKSEYYKIRFNDTSAYLAISNRMDINNSTTNCFRGDCFINYYTHRVNRNYNDPTALYNDTIIEHGSFRKGFIGCFDSEYRTFDLTKDSEAAEAFNIGDLNAVSLGSWITFPIRSSMNTSLRSSDGSFTDEVLACGHNRTFYPLYSLDAGGSNKIPESSAFNKGFNKSGGDRDYYNLDLNVWINTYYRNRIVYSNILQHNAFENGHRVFISTHFRDYTDLYGEIIKLIDLSGNLLVICEHGIYLIPVNERALAGEGAGGQVFINTSNVLPENPKILSDTYGSTWVESVVKTPYGVFGVDEQSKKIWYTNGLDFKLISDFSVLKFLNDHLYTVNSLKIGNTNIKTHYNKYKNDVMFTLYDIDLDLSITPDNLWNLCWNINSSTWQTFYSWIPLDSQNIGNNFISINLNEDNNNTRYFWKHGQSERVPEINKILPTKWYGELHPFEFEFIVKEGPDTHKIFDNLKIISNKAAPESFHYEIVGECYEFADLKENAYYCLEKLKSLYDSKYGISYDTNYTRIHPTYNSVNFGKQISFPIYYTRDDIKNLIYDVYKLMFAPKYDYNYLTGTEVIRDKQKDEYRLWEHTKGVDMDKHGLLRGNMRYKEDSWYVQINPIMYVHRNTTSNLWDNGAPVFMNDLHIETPTDNLVIPEQFNLYVDNKTDNKRRSVKVKDKYIKVRIRYKGDELALITAINTLYTISFS